MKAREQGGVTAAKEGNNGSFYKALQCWCEKEQCFSSMLEVKFRGFSDEMYSVKDRVK